MDNIPVINESDCCGNGCVHCVLNVGSRKSLDVDKQGKYNVISDYREFRLLDKRFHNTKGEYANNGNQDLPEVLELHFRVADLPNNGSGYILEIPVGYHLMMRTTLPSGTVWLRPYSPYWVDALTMEFKILVNLSPNGHMSRFINDLQTGDVVEFRGPIGAYKHVTSPDKERFILVITQGVAIAPTLRIVKRILDDEDDFSTVLHLVCYRDLQHAFFRDMLREFNKYWNYKNSIYLSQQQCSPEMCENAKCTGKCLWFIKNLWYKESVHLRRLTEYELVEICKGLHCSKLEFVIAGGTIFQNSVSEMINSHVVDVPDKNIFQL